MTSILIADDSSLARMVTKRSLEVAGLEEAEFTEAVDGQEAFELLRQKRFDLLVTDLTMPRMDGVQLLREVKAISLLRSMPVVVITSAGNKARREELKELGADAVFSKPLDVPDLVATLEKIFPELQE